MRQIETEVTKVAAVVLLVEVLLVSVVISSDL